MGPTETRQRSRNSIRDCGHGAVVFCPRGFCFKISVFPKSFLFLNSSDIIYYSVSIHIVQLFYLFKKVFLISDILISEEASIYIHGKHEYFGIPSK